VTTSHGRQAWDGHSEHAWGIPAPPLRGLVVAYHGYRDEKPALVAQRELPAGRVPLVLDMGTGWRIATSAAAQPLALRSFVAGLHATCALVEPAGLAWCVQVDLTPLGARQLLGVRMADLAERVVALDALLGGEAGALADRLAEMPTWQARFAVLDAVLVRRLTHAPPVAPEVAWAWHRLEATGGAASITALGATLGWTRKRLVARFREDVGLPPKTVARVLRFAALVRRVRAAGSDLSWAALAAETGYADQAHLAREVHRCAGLTPTALRAVLALSAPHAAPER